MYSRRLCCGYGRRNMNRGAALDSSVSGDLQPTDQLPSLVVLLPPVVHSASPSSGVYSAASHSGTCGYTDRAPRLNGSAPLACTNSPPSCGFSPVSRPTGLGTTPAYWNTRAVTHAVGRGEVNRGTRCASGHAHTVMLKTNLRSPDYY